MRIILFISLLLVNVCTFGQKLDYSVTLSVGYPYIPSVEVSRFLSTQFLYTDFENYKSKSGFKFGVNLSYATNSNFSIEGGLHLNLVRFQRTSGSKDDGLNELILGRVWDMDLQAQEGLPWGVIYGPRYTVDENGEIIYEYYEYTEPKNYDKLGNTSTLYAEFPIILAYSFSNKIKFKVGIIPSIIAYATVYKYYQEDFIYFEGTSNIIKKNNTADGFTNLLWNGKIGIEYLAFKNIGLNVDYVRSLNSIYDEGISRGKPKYNIFSLGFTYHFQNNQD